MIASPGSLEPGGCWTLIQQATLNLQTYVVFEQGYTSFIVGLLQDVS